MNTAPTSFFDIGKLLSNSTVQAVLGVLILMAVCSVAFYLLSKLRDSARQDVHGNDLLRKNFEEMKSGGDISDAEFRNIASLLANGSRRSSALPADNQDQSTSKSDEK